MHIKNAKKKYLKSTGELRRDKQTAKGVQRKLKLSLNK